MARSVGVVMVLLLPRERCASPPARRKRLAAERAASRLTGRPAGARSRARIRPDAARHARPGCSRRPRRRGPRTGHLAPSGFLLCSSTGAAPTREITHGPSRFAVRLPAAHGPAEPLPPGSAALRRLFEILKLLFSEREAALVAVLPLKPFTVAKAAAIWKTSEAEARKVLDGARLARAPRGHREGRTASEYVLPPPMAGFFEFSMMRVRGDLDQKALAELFYQYLNVEEDFVRALFAGGETQLGRAFVHEPALSEDDALHVLDFERASEVIRTATHRGVGLCYCRHKMQHVGRACDAPQDICMTFNTSAAGAHPPRPRAARWTSPRGSTCCTRRTSAASCSSARTCARAVNFICNCCGCCCEAMIAARRFAAMHPVHTTALPPRGGRRRVQRLRAVRARLPGGGDERRVGERPAAARSAPSRGSTRSAASAAASASAPARDGRSPCGRAAAAGSRRSTARTAPCSWPSSAGSCRT